MNHEPPMLGWNTGVAASDSAPSSKRLAAMASFGVGHPAVGHGHGVLWVGTHWYMLRMITTRGNYIPISFLHLAIIPGCDQRYQFERHGFRMFSCIFTACPQKRGLKQQARALSFGPQVVPKEQIPWSLVVNHHSSTIDYPSIVYSG